MNAKYDEMQQMLSKLKKMSNHQIKQQNTDRQFKKYLHSPNFSFYPLIESSELNENLTILLSRRPQYDHQQKTRQRSKKSKTIFSTSQNSQFFNIKEWQQKPYQREQFYTNLQSKDPIQSNIQTDRRANFRKKDELLVWQEQTNKIVKNQQSPLKASVEVVSVKKLHSRSHSTSNYRQPKQVVQFDALLNKLDMSKQFQDVQTIITDMRKTNKKRNKQWVHFGDE